MTYAFGRLDITYSISVSPFSVTPISTRQESPWRAASLLGLFNIHWQLSINMTSQRGYVLLFPLYFLLDFGADRETEGEIEGQREDRKRVFNYFCLEIRG